MRRSALFLAGLAAGWALTAAAVALAIPASPTPNFQADFAAARFAGSAPDRELRRSLRARHDHHLDPRAAALFRPAGSSGAEIRRRRRAARLHLVGRHLRRQQARVAGLDAAGADAAAPARSAAPHGWRHRKPARRSRIVSRLLGVPHPRLQRARHDWPSGVVRLHPHDQRRRHRPLRPRQRRRQGRSSSNKGPPARRRASPFFRCRRRLSSRA